MSWRTTKILPSVALIPVLLLASSCATSHIEFEANYASSRRALLEGKLTEAMSSFEAQAKEAEKDAEASWFPQQYWEAATGAYREASRTARLSGQLQKAITYGEKALEMAANTKKPVPQVDAINVLISTHRSVRNFAKARELMEKGLEILQRIPAGSITRIQWESLFYNHLGLDLMRRREYENAINAYSQSLDLRETHLAILRPSQLVATEDARTQVMISLNGLGSAYLQAGKLEQALEQYQHALNSMNEWGLRYVHEGGLYWNMGEVYRLQKKFPEALENFQKALALAEGQRRPAAIRSASVRIGDILRQTRKPAEAIPYYQKTIQQIESTRSLLESEEYRQSFFEGGIGPYISMMRILLAAGKPDEAFNYSERARSRVLLDVLGSRVQLSRVKSGLLDEERGLQERIAATKASLSGEADGEIDRSFLIKQLAEAERAYNAFLARVRTQDKEHASLISVEPLTLKEVQELLDPGTTLIEYYVTGQEVFVWVVENEKLQFQKVELAKDKLAGLVKTLRESIFALGEREKFNESSASLYKQLFEPLLPHVTGKELIIVPHDVLHYLPFHALVGSDGRYLIEKYPIYYLSSASLLQFVKEKRRASGDLSAVLAQAGKVLAFGNPDLGDPEKNLEFAELEAQEVKVVYPESTVYLRKEATEEKSKALSANHDILHFATHAELNENDPLSSAVLLAKSDKEDGRLEVREIFGMDLKANLVVLSGCETGLGKLSTGDELVGLTRAFIYAGTPSVVASLWKVDDSSTASLMGSFYKNLKTMTKVEALRQAQLEMIRGGKQSDLLARRGIGGVGKLSETPSSVLPVPSSDPHAPNSVATSHPYFWAPFILVGDGK